MQKKILTILKYVFFLGLAFGLVYWSIHKMSPQEFTEFIHSLKTANYSLILPVFIILSLSHLSRAARWRILMGSMGYKPRLINTYAAVMIGYLANFAVPRLGEVLKCTLLSKYEKVPVDKLVGTMLVERAVDLLSFFIVIAISLITQAHVVGDFAKEKLSQLFLTPHHKHIAFVKIALILTVLAVGFLLLKFVFNKYLHIPLVQKIKDIYTGIIEGLLSVKNLKNKWSFIFHSLFIWGCYILGTYIGFLAIKETAILPFLATFPVLAFATVAMILMPGGIGLYPILFVQAMQLYNIPEVFSKANGWLQWSAQFVIILFWGFICILILPYINKNKNEIIPGNTTEDLSNG